MDFLELKVFLFVNWFVCSFLNYTHVHPYKSEKLYCRKFFFSSGSVTLVFQGLFTKKICDKEVHILKEVRHLVYR